MDKLLVDVGKQGNACIFELYPITPEPFEKKLDSTQKFERVYVSYKKTEDPEQLVGTMYQQILTLLTGLSEPTIEELGGFAFRNPVTGQEIFRKQAQDE